MTVVHTFLECFYPSDLSVLDFLGVAKHLYIVSYLGSALLDSAGGDSASSGYGESTIDTHHKWLVEFLERHLNRIVHILE